MPTDESTPTRDTPPTSRSSSRPSELRSQKQRRSQHRRRVWQRSPPSRLKSWSALQRGTRRESQMGLRIAFHIELLVACG